MRTAFALDKCGECALWVVGLLLVLLAFLRLAGRLFFLLIHHSPASVKNLLTRHFELNSAVVCCHFTQHGGCREFAIGIENGNESQSHQIVNIPFGVAKACARDDTCGDDGVVVGHFRGVEHLLRLLQCLATQRSHEFGIGCLVAELRLEKTVHDARTLWIDIVREVSGVHTRIGGQFLLIKTLDEIQRHLGRIRELLVAIHLKRGEVVELWRRFGTFLLLHTRHRERLAGNLLEGFLTLLLTVEPSLRGGEGGIAINRCQHPIRFGLERVDFLLSVHDERQRGRLNTTDGEHLTVLPVLQSIEPSGIHAQNPVADGTREASQIEWLVFVLVFQLLETFTNSVVGHRRNPQSFHGALCTRLLHHPSLNQFTLLPGITAVDNAIGLFHQSLDDGELLLDSFVFNQFDAEARWNHGKRRQAPPFPLVGVVVRFFQRAKVAESPSHLIAVAFHVSVSRAGGADDSGDVACHAGFLCNANNHVRLMI